MVNVWPHLGKVNGFLSNKIALLHPRCPSPERVRPVLGSPRMCAEADPTPLSPRARTPGGSLQPPVIPPPNVHLPFCALQTDMALSHTVGAGREALAPFALAMYSGPELK